MVCLMANHSLECLQDSPSAGITISVLFSIVLVIYRSSRPYVEILGRLPSSTTYRYLQVTISILCSLHQSRNVKRFPQALVIPRMFILRFDAALYFANIGLLSPAACLPVCLFLNAALSPGFLKERLRNEEKKKIIPFSLCPSSDVENDRNKLLGILYHSSFIALLLAAHGFNVQVWWCLTGVPSTISIIQRV